MTLARWSFSVWREPTHETGTPFLVVARTPSSKRFDKREKKYIYTVIDPRPVRMLKLLMEGAWGDFISFYSTFFLSLAY